MLLQSVHAVDVAERSALLAHRIGETLVALRPLRQLELEDVPGHVLLGEHSIRPRSQHSTIDAGVHARRADRRPHSLRDGLQRGSTRTLLVHLGRVAERPVHRVVVHRAVVGLLTRLADHLSLLLHQLHATLVRRLRLLIQPGLTRHPPHGPTLRSSRVKQRPPLQAPQPGQVVDVLRRHSTLPRAHPRDIRVRRNKHRPRLTTQALLAHHRPVRAVAQNVQLHLRQGGHAVRLLKGNHLLSRQHLHLASPVHAADKVAGLHLLHDGVTEARLNMTTVTKIQRHHPLSLTLQHAIQVALPTCLKQRPLLNRHVLHLLQRHLTLLRSLQGTSRRGRINAARGEPPCSIQRPEEVAIHVQHSALEEHVVREASARRLIRGMQELHGHRHRPRVHQVPQSVHLHSSSHTLRGDALQTVVARSVELETRVRQALHQQIHLDAVKAVHLHRAGETTVHLRHLHLVDAARTLNSQHPIASKIPQVKDALREHAVLRLRKRAAGHHALGRLILRTQTTLADAQRRAGRLQPLHTLRDLLGDTIVPHTQLLRVGDRLQHAIHHVARQQIAHVGAVEPLVQLDGRPRQRVILVDEVQQVAERRIVQTQPAVSAGNANTHVLHASHHGRRVRLNRVSHHGPRHVHPLGLAHLRQLLRAVHVRNPCVDLLDAVSPVRHRVKGTPAAHVLEQHVPLCVRLLQPVRLRLALLRRLQRERVHQHLHVREIQHVLHHLHPLQQSLLGGVVQRRGVHQLHAQRLNNSVLRLLRQHIRLVPRQLHGQTLLRRLPDRLEHRLTRTGHRTQRAQLPQQRGQIPVRLLHLHLSFHSRLQLGAATAKLAGRDLQSQLLHRMTASRSLQDAQVRVLARGAVRVQRVMQLLALHQCRQAHVDHAHLRQTPVRGVLHHTREHDRLQQRSILRGRPQLHKPFSGQALPVDDSAVLVDERVVGASQHVRILAGLLDRRGSQRSPATLLLGAKLELLVPAVEQAVHFHHGRRLALIGHVRHDAHEHTDVRPLHGGRAEARPIRRGEVQHVLQVPQQRGRLRVRVPDSVLQLRQRNLIRGVPQTVLHGGRREPGRLLRERRERLAPRRARQHLAPAARRHARINLRHVPAPRSERCLLAAQLGVHKRDEVVHVVHVEQCVIEPRRHERASVSRHAPHQLVQPILQVVVRHLLADRAVHIFDVERLHAPVARQQRVPEQIHLGLLRALRHQLVHPARQGGHAARRVNPERTVNLRVAQQLKEPAAHHRVTVQQGPPCVHAVRVDAQRPCSLLQLREALAQRRRRPVALLADPAARLPVAERQHAVAALQQAIHHRLIRRDRRVAVQIAQVVRQVVTALLPVHRLVRRVQLQHPRRLSAAPIRLVHVLADELCHRHVLAKHEAVQPHQLLKAVRAVHLDKRLARVHRTHPAQLALKRKISLPRSSLPRAHLLGGSLLAQQPLGQSHPAHARALNLRHHHVRQQRNRQALATVVGVRRRRQPLNLRSDRRRQIVLRQQLSHRAHALAARQRLVHRRHPLGRLSDVALLARQLRASEPRVVQRLPLAEQVGAADVQAHRLRNARSLPGHHLPDLRLGLHRAHQMLLSLNGVLRRLSKLEVLKTAMHKRVQLEPRVRPLFLADRPHLRRVPLCQSSQQVLLRRRNALPRFPQERRLLLLGKRDTAHPQHRAQLDPQILDHIRGPSLLRRVRAGERSAQQLELLLLKRARHHVHVRHRAQQVPTSA